MFFFNALIFKGGGKCGNMEREERCDLRSYKEHHNFAISEQNAFKNFNYRKYSLTLLGYMDLPSAVNVSKAYI